MNPQLLSHIETPHGDEFNVAHLNGQIFTVDRNSDCINVYSDRFPFEEIKQFPIKQLKGVFSLVACQEIRCLFLAEFVGGIIWKVNTSTLYAIDEFIIHKPGVKSLSITRARLLVVSHTNQLNVYDVEYGELLLSVQLAKSMCDPTHVIESDRQSFFVSHSGRRANDQRGVSEVDSCGHVVGRWMIGQGPTCWPAHVISDSVGGVLVAESNGRRIVRLSDSLDSHRVLISRLQLKYVWKPYSLCFESSCHRLLVAMSGGRLNVYEYRV